MNKILGTYVNGNTIVVMREDGTKERYIRDGEKPAPEFPESMDLKITNKCTGTNCRFCAECSSPDGKHADLRHPIFDTIKPYTELAIGGGNPLEHPDLVWFLDRMKAKKVICNITVNAVHFMKNSGVIGNLAEHGLIHGIGVSVPDNIPNGLIALLRQYPNAVIHTIAGVTPPLVFDQFADHNFNLLILGYKTKGKGYQCFIDNEQMILDRIYGLEQRLPWLKKHFKAVAFDNLAVKQLNLQKNLPGEDYDKLYMGDDGEFTMYIDMVEKRYGKSSSHYLRPIDFEMAPAIADLFQELKKIKMINRYKLKDGITIQDIETEIKQRRREDKSFHGTFGNGGTWINDKTHVDTHFISCQCGNQDISLNIGFPRDLSRWDDFEDVLILDEEFGQPYVPFYSAMDDETIAFPFLLNIIGNYNKLMNSFSFLEKKE